MQSITETRKALPTWILIVSGLFAVMELAVSVALCVAPESVAENVDLSAKGIDYLMYMWAARQFALGVIFAVATIKRSVPMLTISYLFFLVMFLGDLLIGITQKENGMVISAAVMCLISIAMLVALNKKS
jgi:hypothetical protein